MNTTDPDPLLAELFSDCADPAFRSAMLAHTLARARRRVTMRRVLQGVAAGAVMLLAVAALWFPPPRTGRNTAQQISESRPVAPPPVLAAIEPVRRITDEELLARFPDRAVALIGPADRRRFVFLDTD